MNKYKVRIEKRTNNKNEIETITSLFLLSDDDNEETPVSWSSLKHKNVRLDNYLDLPEISIMWDYEISRVINKEEKDIKLMKVEDILKNITIAIENTKRKIEQMEVKNYGAQIILTTN